MVGDEEGMLHWGLRLIRALGKLTPKLLHWLALLLVFRGAEEENHKHEAILIDVIDCGIRRSFRIVIKSRISSRSGRHATKQKSSGL